MNAEVIKSFLVGLGFGVDEASLAKFNKAIVSASAKVAAMYAGVQAAAAGIFYSIANISKGFEEMGYEYRLVAPAINRALMLRHELTAAYKAAGVNLVSVIQNSIRFNLSLQKTKISLQALSGSVASKFFPLLTKQMDLFRSKIYANMPRIQKALQGFVEFIFKAFEGTVHLGQTVWSILGRVYDFFKKLDEATDGWSTKILAFIAVWKLLNLSFLATPLGAILAGLVGILALYDDFKTWSEGGKSLFDWSKALPAIENVKLALSAIKSLCLSVFSLFQGIANNDFSKLLDALNHVIDAFASINTLMDRLVKSFHVGIFEKLLDFRNSIDNAFLSSANGAPVGGYMNPAYFASQPLGVGAQNNSSQVLNQQTSIHVAGSPDANATANAIASQQANVNADLARNARSVAR